MRTCEACGHENKDPKQRPFCSLSCFLRAHEARARYVRKPGWLWSASIAARMQRKREGLTR